MLIALEGIDGSGKQTQTALLADRLRFYGSVSTFSFPQYGRNAFGSAIGEYLNGRFGDLDAVHPKLAAVLYAGDRFSSGEELVNATQNSVFVICDRYVPSNVAYQAAKLPPNEWAAFITWLSEIEYDIFRLPRPDLNILLDVPVEIAVALTRKKGPRIYTTLDADIHERNLSYLQACSRVYDALFGQPEQPWIRISCCSNGNMRPPDEIADDILCSVLHDLQQKGRQP